MFFFKPTSEQAIALASVFHCCELVSQLANTGEASSEDMAMCMGALLNQNPDSLSQLYGPVSGLTMGMKSMQRLFSDGNRGQTEIMRYVISTLYLARKLFSIFLSLDNLRAR